MSEYASEEERWEDLRERLLRLGACSRLPDAFATDMVRAGFDPRYALVAQIALSVSKL